MLNFGLQSCRKVCMTVMDLEEEELEHEEMEVVQNGDKEGEGIEPQICGL